MLNIGYTRVSTQEQDYNNQIINLKEYNQNIEEFINEKISSGKSLKERKLFNLLNNAEKGTNIFITNLDRLARNTAEILEIIQICKDNEITIHITKIGIKIGLNMNPMDKMFITIMGSFAEMEKEIIIDRIKDGQKKYILDGGKIGRQKGDKIKSKLDPYQSEILKFLDIGLKPTAIKTLLKKDIEISLSMLNKYISKLKTDTK